MRREADRIVLDERLRGDWLRYGRRAVVKAYAAALEAHLQGVLLLATPLEDMKEEWVPGLRRAGSGGRPVAALAIGPGRLLAVFNPRFEPDLKACLTEEADLTPLGVPEKRRGAESVLALAYLLYERLGTNLRFEPYLGVEG